MTIDKEAIAVAYAKHIIHASGAPFTDEVLQRFKNRGLELIDDIEAKSDRFLQRCIDGLLNPCNKGSRQLFAEVTGLSLPKTQRDTWNVLRSYCGQELKAYEDRLDRQRAEVIAEEKRLKAESEAKKIAEASLQFATGMPIDSESFLLLAKHYEIELHARTIGAIRDRFRTIGRHGVTMVQTRKGDKIPKGIVYAICDVFRKVVESKEKAK